MTASTAQLLLDRIDSFVTCMQTTPETAKNALQFAVALDHPSYDCLYLALAEGLGTKLVTADARFATKLERHGLGHLVIRLSDGVARAVNPVISESDLQRVLALSARYDATIESVYRQLKPTGKTFTFVKVGDLGPAFDSPAAHRLEKALSDLSEDQLTDLAALAWLGRGFDGQNFADLKQHALTTFHDGPARHLPYIASLLRYVEQGLHLLARQENRSR